MPVIYLKRMLIFAGIVSLLAFFLYQWIIPQYYLSIFPFLIVFFVLTTIAVHFILTKAGKQKITRFSTYFMGSISVKLIIYILFITIYAFTCRETAVPFLITFLLLYFVFTFFETYSLLNTFKKENQSLK